MKPNQQDNTEDEHAERNPELHISQYSFRGVPGSQAGALLQAQLRVQRDDWNFYLADLEHFS
jgi:hypothetical protein